MSLEADDINLVDPISDESLGSSNGEPSLRDTIRDAVDKQREPEGDKTDKPAARRDGRDGQGRFTSPNAQQAADDVRKIAQNGPQTQHPSQQTQPTAQQAPNAQAIQTAFQPPVGWPQQAKEAFTTLPPHVQEAIAQREQQINQGFAILQNYKGLEKFSGYVQQSGVTFHDVMDRAVKWEEGTLRDPVGTILHLARIRGISPQLLVQAVQNPRVAEALRLQIAQRHGAQPQPQQQYLTPDQARQLAREEFTRATQEREIDTDISKFLADPAHQHASAVVDDMVMLINSGRADKLTDAYQMALRLHPELAQTVNRPQPTANPRQQAVSQARSAAKAVTGSPVGTHTRMAKPPENASLRDTIRAAYNAQRGLDDD